MVKVNDQVKKIILYGIELDAERKESMSIPEHKKHELDKLDYTEKTDNLLESFFEKDAGRNLIPSDSGKCHKDIMATIQNIEKRLQK